MGKYVFFGVLVSSLLGFSTINLDAKGRLAVPTKFRPELQESCEGRMVITLAVNEDLVGLEGCIWLYPLHEWEVLEQTILDFPSNNKAASSLKRFLIGNANECELDSQGRVLVPEILRDFAKLEKRVVLSGQLNKFEIWNEAIWNAKQQEMMTTQKLEGAEDLGQVKF